MTAAEIFGDILISSKKQKSACQINSLKNTFRISGIFILANCPEKFRQGRLPEFKI